VIRQSARADSNLSATFGRAEFFNSIGHFEKSDGANDTIISPLKADSLPRQGNAGLVPIADLSSWGCGTSESGR
jgi:hypothetical protein